MAPGRRGRGRRAELSSAREPARRRRVTPAGPSRAARGPGGRGRAGGHSAEARPRRADQSSAEDPPRGLQEAGEARPAVGTAHASVSDAPMTGGNRGGATGGARGSPPSSDGAGRGTRGGSGAARSGTTRYGRSTGSGRGGCGDRSSTTASVERRAACSALRVGGQGVARVAESAPPAARDPLGEVRPAAHQVSASTTQPRASQRTRAAGPPRAALESCRGVSDRGTGCVRGMAQAANASGKARG